MDIIQKTLEKIDAKLGTQFANKGLSLDEVNSILEKMPDYNAQNLTDLTSKVDAFGDLNAKIEAIESKIPTDVSSEVATLKTELAETKTALEASTAAVNGIKAELKTVQDAMKSDTKTVNTEIKIAETTSDVSDLPETASKWS